MLAPTDLSIGDWWAPCCVHDLAEIRTPEELEDARYGMPYAGGWHTLREAVAALLTRDCYMRQEDLDEDIAYARERFPAGFVADV